MEQGQKKKENGGYLYRNTDKRSAKSPDWRGKVTWKGEELLISGWNDPARGEMISISLTDPATLPPKQDAGGRPAAAQSTPAPSSGQQGSFAPRQDAPAAQHQAAAGSGQGQAGGMDDAFDDLDDLEKLFKS